jgi:hypothetical protein
MSAPSLSAQNLEAARIVTDPRASASLRWIAWLALKTATGKPARQIM